MDAAPAARATHRRLRARWTLVAAVALAVAAGARYSGGVEGPPDVERPRLVRAEADAEGLRGASFPATALARSFAGHAGYQAELAGAPASTGPQRLAAAVVCGRWFDAAGVGPSLGRVLGPGDDRLGAPAALVLSEEAWRERFGADPSVLGRAVHLNGRSFTVVGVAAAPRAAGLGSAALGWVSASAWAQVEGGAYVRLERDAEPGTG